MTISRLILIIFLGFRLNASAQSIQQRKTDSVFQLVKKCFNLKQADGIYELAGQGFRKELTAETFRYVCANQLFPLGEIKESSLISFVNDKVATYKIVFDAATLQLLMNLDGKDKLELFLFQPFKQEAADNPTAVPTTNLMKTLTDKNIDSAARKYIQKANTVGLSIGILKNGAITTYNYGETARGNRTLPDANTLFEIGSITKTFTSTLLAYYVNDGKVKLDDPITKYLPDSVAANKELQGITLQMLSNHTCGLPRLPDNFEFHSTSSEDPYKDYTKQYLLDYLKTAKLAGKPGKQYAYSNLAVGLLGAILEQVNGKTFAQMVQQVITQPLNMQSTAQTLNLKQQNKFVKVYNENGKETSPWHFDVLAPCGALKSTVTDLLTYAKAQMTPADNKLLKAMQLTHQVTFTRLDMKLGLAWHIIVIDNVAYYFHDGGTYGCSSFLVFNPETKLAVVVLSNSGANVNALGADIVKRIQ